MSVIVRMEMPKNCCECQLRQEDYDTGEEFCPFTGVECLSIGRQDNCPILCSLPEGHGRLVDEKEVKDWVENWLCVNKYYHPYSSSKSIPVSELYDVFQRMDAAVPAERSET